MDLRDHPVQLFHFTDKDWNPKMWRDLSWVTKPGVGSKTSTFAIMLTMSHQMNLSAFPYAQHIQTFWDRGKTKQIQCMAQRMQNLYNWAQSNQNTGIFNKAATWMSNRVPCVLEWRLHGGRSCGQVGWRQIKRGKRDTADREDGRRNLRSLVKWAW